MTSGEATGEGSEPTLGAIGERRIISDILVPRYARSTTGFGDDCAHLVSSELGPYLVATTDPCPEPAAALAGYNDLFYRGWLLACINLSDIAAAGATPIGLLTSLQLPAETTVGDFQRLLDGIDACCAAAGTRVVGGNLKESESIDLSATAIGHCDGPPLSRSGAREGDLAVVVGDLGHFWALFLLATELNGDIDSSRLMDNLRTPVPKVAVGRELRTAGIINAAIDNSDGLYPSLDELARSAGLGVLVDLDELSLDDDVIDISRDLGLAAARLILGWGDWQLIVAISPADLSTVERICSSFGLSAQSIGVFSSGSGVQARYNGTVGFLMQLESERFVKTSWFRTGLSAYVDRMRTDAIVL